MLTQIEKRFVKMKNEYEKELCELKKTIKTKDDTIKIKDDIIESLKDDNKTKDLKIAGMDDIIARATELFCPPKEKPIVEDVVVPQENVEPLTEEVAEHVEPEAEAVIIPEHVEPEAPAIVIPKKTMRQEFADLKTARIEDIKVRKAAKDKRAPSIWNYFNTDYPKFIGRVTETSERKDAYNNLIRKYPKLTVVEYITDPFKYMV